MTYYFISASLLSSDIFIGETKDFPEFTNIFIDTNESIINYHAGLSLVKGLPLKTIFIHKIFNNHFEDLIFYNLPSTSPKVICSTNKELIIEIKRILKNQSTNLLGG